MYFFLLFSYFFYTFYIKLLRGEACPLVVIKLIKCRVLRTYMMRIPNVSYTFPSRIIYIVFW